MKRALLIAVVALASCDDPGSLAGPGSGLPSGGATCRCADGSTGVRGSTFVSASFDGCVDDGTCCASLTACCTNLTNTIDCAPGPDDTQRECQAELEEFECHTRLGSVQGNPDGSTCTCEPSHPANGDTSSDDESSNDDASDGGGSSGGGSTGGGSTGGGSSGTSATCAAFGQKWCECFNENGPPAGVDPCNSDGWASVCQMRYDECPDYWACTTAGSCDSFDSCGSCL